MADVDKLVATLQWHQQAMENAMQQLKTMPRHYILRIDSPETGEVCKAVCNLCGADDVHPYRNGGHCHHCGSDRLRLLPKVEEARFAVIAVTDKYAEIVDDGYRSYEEAKAAWPDAK